MELFSCARRVRGEARGIASVHDSGGERALFVDRGARSRRAVRGDRRADASAIDDTLDPGLEAENPLDAWGTGIDADRIFRESFLALHEDPDTAALAFVVDLTRQGEPYDEGYLQMAQRRVRGDDQAVLRAVEPGERVALEEAAQLLRDAGIPVLEGTRQGWWRCGRSDRRARCRARPPLELPRR